MSIDYDALILETGATPIKPPIAGTDLKDIFILHDVEDAEGIELVFVLKKSKNVIIGLDQIVRIKLDGKIGSIFPVDLK